MDDGLEVSLDANLLNDFFQDGSNAVSSIAEDDGCFQDSAFNWADDFISSAQETEEVNSSVQQPTLSSVNMAPNQPKVAVDISSQVSSAVGHQRIMQQPSSTITSQQILQNSAGIIHGIGGQQFIISPSGSIQLPQNQLGQQQLTNHASGQQFSIPSPLVSRSLTPSQSPAPAPSPHNRSLTPNQTLINHNLIQNHTAASSPSIIQFSNNAQQSQAQVHVASAVPVQSILQNANPNANIMQGQAVVHTQNAVIQNPNVVNVNVAHVLCNNSPQTQLQGSIQGLPVAVSNTNIHGNPVNIQGTIIQTPQGKSILIPNQQLAGQQINLQNFQQLQMQPQQVQVQSQTVQIQPHQIQVNPQQVNLGQHIMSNSGTLVQNQQGGVSLGNIIRLATQTGQDKGAGLPPNISLINLPGGQGQQILIQRAPNPTTGQPQNIVLRTISPNIVQIQNPNQSGQVGNISGTPMQITSNISQQIVNQNNQGIQLQQVFPGGHTQQMKLGNQQAPQQRLQAGTVTLNLAGQNINFQPMAAGAMQGIQLVQQTQTSSVPASMTVTATRPSISTNSANQLSNIVSKALISSGISPAINSQSPLGHLDANNAGKALNNQASVMKQPKPPKQVDLQQVHGNSVPSLQKVQIPVSQFIATAFNSAGISTVQSTPTIATTTVSQSFVQIPSQLTVASSLSASQTLSSVSTTSTAQLAGSVLKIHHVAANSNRNTPPVVSVSAMQIPVANSNEQMQRLQNEIMKLSMQKKLTPEQKQRLQQMSMLQKQMAQSAAARTVVSSAVQPSNVVTGSVQPCPVSVLATAKFQPQTKVAVVKDQQTRVASPMHPITVVSASAVSNKKQIIKQEPSPQSVLPPCDKTMVKSEPVVQMCMPVTGQKIVKVEPQVVSASSVLPDSNPVSAVLCSRQNVVIQSSSVGTNLVRMSVPQMVSSAGMTSVGNQQIKIIHQAPLKKVIPVTQAQVIKIHPTPAPNRTTVAGGVVRNIPPGKVPISATPTVPTQIKIANQTLTLNLTAQQKEKLLNHLAKMTQEQQEMFLEQQQSILLKLHQQHQAQARSVSQPQVQVATSIESKPQLLVASPASKIPTPVQQLDKCAGVNQIKVVSQTDTTGQQSSPAKGLKRPAAADGQPVSLIHQQLGKDQIHATAPDVKSPFKNNREAVRRLLRYHVFQSPGPPQKAFDKADKLFEQVSVELLKKSEAMKAKFQLLLFDESMRQSPSAEMVMIHRMLNQDLSSLLEREKKIVETNPDDFEPMPLKYLKLDKGEKSVVDKDKTGEGSVKFKKESDVKAEECENKKANPVDSLKVSVKSSPAHSPGGMKLVIRKNEGQGFTSTLQNGDEKTESVSGTFSVKQEPVVSSVNGIHSDTKTKTNKAESKNMVVDHVHEINSDVCSFTKTTNKSESKNMLLDHVHSPEKTFDSERVLKLDSRTSKDLLNSHVDAGSHCVNDLAPFHSLGESLEEEHVSDTSESQRASESSQPHYSDISVTDLSAEYSTMLSPVSNPASPRPHTAAGNDISVQSSQNFPSVFSFNADLCSSQESGAFCGSAVTGKNINEVKTSTDLPSVNMESSSDLSFLNRCDDMPYTTNLPSSNGGGGGNEIQSAVYSIMELEDVSSDSSAIADESLHSVDKMSVSKRPVIPSDTSVSPIQTDFSPHEENKASGSNGLVNHDDSEPVNLDASFELDTNDPQNGMMNAQMQNAIESILSLNQDPESVEEGFYNDQSHFVSDLTDSQVSESMDTSQDSDCVIEDSEPDQRDDSLVSNTADIAESHSVEDDLDAAVQSILM